MSSAEAKKLALIAVGVVLALPLLAATGGGSAGAALAALSYLGQAGLPRGMRNNNPGNIRISGNAWQGKIPVSSNTDGAFEQFKSYVYGIRAMILNLRSYFNNGNNTLRKIITKWAPAADNNDTAAYIFTVSAKTGFGPDQVLTFDQGTLRKLVRAMAFVENGRDAVTDQQFNYAWGLAGIGAIYEEIPEIYRCNDGTYTSSPGRRACHRHGGRESDVPITRSGGAGSSLLPIQDVPLDQIKVNRELFQGREKAFSQRSVDNIVYDVETGRFIWANLDPITLWKSPEGILYLLSGHSRLEAFRILRNNGARVDGKTFDRIPAKIYQADLQAAQRLALESNTLSTKETDVERAAYYRRLRQDGVEEKAILAQVKKNEGKNWINVYAYTFLSPSGKAWNTVKQFGEQEDTSATLAKSLVKWIGNARRNIPQLTNEHEAELYNWLFEQRGYGTGAGQVSNERDFQEKVSTFVQKNTFFGQFDADKPLNIMAAQEKSPAEQQYDAQLTEIQRTIAETERQIKAKTKTLTDQGATKNDLARILAPLEATLRNLRSDYQRLLQKRSEVIEYSKREARLFGRKKRKYGRHS